MNISIVDLLGQAIRGKPTDGSDCQTLEAAQKELGRLRRVTAKVVTALTNAKDAAAKNGSAIAPAPPNPMQDIGNGKLRRGVMKVMTMRRALKARKALAMDQSFKVYKKVTLEKSLEDRTLIKTAIKKNILFKDFSNAQLEEFVDVFVSKAFKEGVAVNQQGDTGDTFYVVQSGALDIFVNAKEGDKEVETQLGISYCRGGTFGELALLCENSQATTIRASEDCVLWTIKREAFKGLQMQIEQSAHETKLKHLKGVKIGKVLLSQAMEPTQLESMAMVTECHSFEAGSAIVREGEKGNAFYMITMGEVDVYKKSAGSDKIATLGVSSFFGEKALLSSDRRQATCVAATNVDCLTLTRDDFVTMLGSLEEVLSGRKTSLITRRTQTEDIFINAEEESAIPLTLHDVAFKRVLGEGAFGKVILVKSKVNGKLFALKAQSKAHIIESGAKEKLLMEYRFMRELRHPCIVKCYQAFQDKKYIFFLMNLLPGGDVLSLLDRHEKLPESWVRFYCGTVVLVFEYIHEQKIAYRDLKPENLVLDEKGCCHVVDFGIGKRCHEGKTWSMCGTPDYLAPEVVMGKGHDWGVDYWALGVLLHELSHGSPPFCDENPANTAKKVINGSYSIPPYFSPELANLVSRLLTHQSKRLGRTKAGVREIRKHPWFSEFGWQALLDSKMKVPWVPELRNLDKLGTKDNGKWDAPDTDWEPTLSVGSDARRSTWQPKRISTRGTGARTKMIHKSVTMALARPKK